MYFLQASEAFTSTINGASYHGCRIVNPRAGRLRKARTSSQNVVTTGTVTVKLCTSFPGDGRSGSVLDTLDNSDLSDYANLSHEYAFTLDDETMDRIFPRGQHFFLIANGDNSADRYSDPTLHLEFDEVEEG